MLYEVTAHSSSWSVTHIVEADGPATAPLCHAMQKAVWGHAARSWWADRGQQSGRRYTIVGSSRDSAYRVYDDEITTLS